MLKELACDPSHGLFTATVIPPASKEAALSCFREIRGHQEFRNSFGILIDLATLDQPPSMSTACALGEIVKAFFPGQKIALILPDSCSHLPWDVLQYLSKPEVQIENFSKRDQAEAWLREREGKTAA